MAPRLAARPAAKRRLESSRFSRAVSLRERLRDLLRNFEAHRAQPLPGLSRPGARGLAVGVDAPARPQRGRCRRGPKCVVRPLAQCSDVAQRRKLWQPLARSALLLQLRRPRLRLRRSHLAARRSSTAGWCRPGPKCVVRPLAPCSGVTRKRKLWQPLARSALLLQLRSPHLRLRRPHLAARRSSTGGRCRRGPKCVVRPLARCSDVARKRKLRQPLARSALLLQLHRPHLGLRRPHLVARRECRLHERGGRGRGTRHQESAPRGSRPGRLLEIGF